MISLHVFAFTLTRCYRVDIENDMSEIDKKHKYDCRSHIDMMNSLAKMMTVALYATSTQTPYQQFHSNTYQSGIHQIMRFRCGTLDGRTDLQNHLRSMELYKTDIIIEKPGPTRVCRRSCSLYAHFVMQTVFFFTSDHLE